MGAHQFLAPADVSFGFFCIVDAERDPPTRLTPEENGLVRAAGAVLPPATEGFLPSLTVFADGGYET